MIDPVSELPITHSRGELEIPVVRLADDDLRDALQEAGVETVRSRGYDSSYNDLLVPETVGGPSANGYSSRMVGILAEISNRNPVWIPVYREDLEPAEDALEAALSPEALGDGGGSADIRGTTRTPDGSAGRPNGARARKERLAEQTGEHPEAAILTRPAVVAELGLPTEYPDGSPRFTYVGHTQYDSPDVYAGRHGSEGEHDLVTSEIGEAGWLGNPYPVGSLGTREEVVEAFQAALWTLLERNAELRRALYARCRGRVLGCWCHRLEETGDEDAPRCHADVIAETVDKHLRITPESAWSRGGEDE
ncbi:DUF4326 domain-containing protein [Halorarum salinum]|uniref:DUF4326 domain-containing protein n=1 Tax=Halorarum salinum TaxID=2743089 RepID=UPI001C52F812|nr:DUF4326 domain-containing protein [Halobaculum salinum]